MDKIKYAIIAIAIIGATIFGNSLKANEAESNPIRISLITCYPGPDVYALYGHTAIRVTQGENDYVFNYGMFSFSEPNFIYRFVKGDAHYILGYYPFVNFMPEYVDRGSKVVEQVLNLTTEEKERMLSLLLDNAKIENRAYRYNYIYDNCSTRPRDLIEKVVGPTLKYAPIKEATDVTFRDMMRWYNSNYPWQQFGIDLALGSGLDHNITQREMMFAPIKLEESLNGATYENQDKKCVSLVAETIVLNEAPEYGAILPPTPWWQTPTFWTYFLLGFTISLTVIGQTRGRWFKGFDCALNIAYTLGGCVIFFLIFVSTHAATSPNLVGVWLNPFYIVPAILIWIKSSYRFLYYYQITIFATLILLLSAWYWLPQVGNSAFYPLMLCPAIRSLNYIIEYRRCVKKGK